MSKQHLSTPLELPCHQEQFKIQRLLLLPRNLENTSRWFSNPRNWAKSPSDFFRRLTVRFGIRPGCVLVLSMWVERLFEVWSRSIRLCNFDHFFWHFWASSSLDWVSSMTSSQPLTSALRKASRPWRASQKEENWTQKEENGRSLWVVRWRRRGPERRAEGREKKKGSHDFFSREWTVGLFEFNPSRGALF